MNIDAIKAILILLSIVGVSCLLPLSLQAQQGGILALASYNLKQYEEAYAGFKEYLRDQGIRSSIDHVVLDGDETKAIDAIEKAKKENCSLILVLGTVAGKAVKDAGIIIPVVAGLMLDADEMSNMGEFSGVTLDIPLDVQFQWLAKMMPNARNVGILYDPARNSERIEAASKIAKNLGIAFSLQRVGKPSDLPDALDAMANSIDAIFGIPDPLIYTPQTAKNILLFSLKNKVPLIGLSEAWVKAGALAALECDYRDIGAQCAQIAIGVLKTRKSGLPQYLGPRKVVYTLNLKTAAQMRIEIPDAIIQGAREVFR